VLRHELRRILLIAELEHVLPIEERVPARSFDAGIDALIVRLAFQHALLDGVDDQGFFLLYVAGRTQKGSFSLRQRGTFRLFVCTFFTPPGEKSTYKQQNPCVVSYIAPLRPPQPAQRFRQDRPAVLAIVRAGSGRRCAKALGFARKPRPSEFWPLPPEFRLLVLKRWLQPGFPAPLGC